MNKLRAAAASLILLSIVGVQADAARRRDSESDARAGAGARNLLLGRLELRWGDAPQGSGIPHRFEAALVDDTGVRHALDPEQAFKAASDLHALFGRRVAVSMTRETTAAATRAKSGAGVRTRIDAIVPVADLQPQAPGGRNGPVAARLEAEAIGGVTSWATIMCKFNDIATEQKTQSFFDSQYGSQPGQLDHYWREVSYGQINLAGSAAYGWFTLPEPRSAYVTKGTDGKDKADLGKLFTDCTTVADASVNFAINGGLQGINMMFNGDLDGFAWGGSRCAALDGVNKCWSTTWNPPWSFGNLAPLSHEMGHGYGLPHANNADNDSDPYDNPWDVMSDAWNNATSSTTYGTLPKHINMYSRDRLGWVAAARKRTINPGTAPVSFALDRAGLAGSTRTQMVILRYLDQTSRYYVIEARRRGGDYENRLAGDAVIVHEVQTGRKEPAWSMDIDTPAANRANNEGSMFKPGEYWTSTDGAFCVRIDSATTDGFNISVNVKCPRLSGPGQRHLAGSGALVAPATARAVSGPGSGPAPRSHGGRGRAAVAKPADRR